MQSNVKLKKSKYSPFVDKHFGNFYLKLDTFKEYPLFILFRMVHWEYQHSFKELIAIQPYL